MHLPPVSERRTFGYSEPEQLTLRKSNRSIEGLVCVPWLCRHPSFIRRNTFIPMHKNVRYQSCRHVCSAIRKILEKFIGIIARKILVLDDPLSIRFHIR